LQPELLRGARSSSCNEYWTGLAGNVLALYALQFGNYVIPLLTMPYLLATLGAARYGELLFAQGLISYVGVLVDYGFDWSATRRVSTERASMEKVWRLAYDVWSAKLLLTTSGLIVVIVAAYLLSGPPGQLSYFLALYAAVIGNALFPTWLYQGMERMWLTAAIGLGAKLAGLAALFLFVKTPEDGLAAAAIIGITGALGGVCGAAAAIRSFGLARPSLSLKGAVNMLVEGWEIFVSRTAVSLYTAGNPFLLGLVSTPQEVAYFSVAERVVRGIVALLTPVFQAVYPRATLVAAQSKEQASRFARSWLAAMGGVGTCLSAVVFAGAELIARLISPAAEKELVLVVRTLAPIILMISLNSVLGTQLLLSFGQDRRFRGILIAAGVANVVLALLLGRQLGAVGMAAAVVIVECFVTASMGAATVEYLKGGGGWPRMLIR